MKLAVSGFLAALLALPFARPHNRQRAMGRHAGRDAMLPFEPPPGSMTQHLRVVWTLLFRRLS